MAARLGALLRLSAVLIAVLMECTEAKQELRKLGDELIHRRAQQVHFVAENVDVFQYSHFSLDRAYVSLFAR